MGFSQLESKKIIDACLRNVAKIAKGKGSGEDRLKEINLQIDLMNAVLSDTDKKKKKSKKRKASGENASTSSVEIVDPSK